MTDSSANLADILRAAHPLARALIARLPSGARVLEIGHGSGRNHRALEAAGLEVLHFGAATAAAREAAGALSTHALLHGTPVEIAALLAQIAGGLADAAPFFATFGSRRDARFGAGSPLGPTTFAPATGDERGVAHTYYDEATLRSAVQEHFAIEDLREVEVDAIAGGWAHVRAPLRGAVHWFLTAHRR
ncbi:MAG: hypothetical protein ACP5O6_13000 [Candidatus Baltobacteraceae bacterium]